MLLALQSAFADLLKTSFPDVFDGSPAPVTVSFPEYEWTLDPSSADPSAGEPTRDDASDLLTFDPAHPEGPYLLSKPPYPGPRRVSLRSASGDRLVLGAAEVQWDETEPRSFTLHPKPTRVLTGFNRVEILYGVTAVYTQLKSRHEMPVLLTGTTAAAAERGEALALAVFALNRDAVMASGAFSETGGGYTARGTIKNLSLRKGSVGSPTTRRFSLAAEIELKVSRALAETEGHPIERIVSPGRTPTGDRKVDIDLDVQS